MNARILKAKLATRAQQSELSSLREALRGPIRFIKPPAKPAQEGKK